MSWTSEAYKQLVINDGTDVSSNTLGSWLFANASQIWCSLPTPKANLAAYSWREIKQIGDALSAGIISASEVNTTYHISIGAERTVVINNEIHTCRIIGILHDQATETSSNKLGFTFEIIDLMSQSSPMFASASTLTARWRTSLIYDIMNGSSGYSNNSDPELIAVISKAAKPCASTIQQGQTVQYTASYFWILSEKELTGSATHTIDNCVEGSQYEYYQDASHSRARGSVYWLRSPQGYDTIYNIGYFLGVNISGTITPYPMDESKGFAPCFCVGQATYCSLDSVISSLAQGNYELTFSVNNTNVKSNKLYIHKEPSIIYFLTADSGNPNFTVLRTAGGSTYDELIVQDPQPPAPTPTTTAVSFVPTTGIKYTTNGGSTVTTISSNQTVNIEASTITFSVESQSNTKITVINNQGAVIYDGQNSYTYTASSGTPSITVTQSALDTRTISGTWVFVETPVGFETSLTENVTFTSGGTTFNSMTVNMNAEVLIYGGTVGVYSFDYQEWSNTIYRTVTFSGTQNVSSSFYTWFTLTADPQS